MKSQVKTLEAEVEKLQADLAATRASHAKLMRAIKAVLGFKHWPRIEGNIVDGACLLLKAEIDAIRIEREIAIKRGDNHLGAYHEQRILADGLRAEVARLKQYLAVSKECQGCDEDSMLREHHTCMEAKSNG